jgi:hypothetical protein
MGATEPRAPAERKRPLRTYSRKPAPELPVERPSKKRKVDTADPVVLEENKAETVKRLLPLPRLPSPKSVKPAKRGSILAYFQPTTSSSSATAPSSDAVAPVSTPPSSPPVLRQKKRRKPIALDEEEEKDVDRPERMDDTEPDSETSSFGKTGPPLMDASSSSLNRKPVSDSLETKRANGGKRGVLEERRRKKPAKKALVQTALNLAIGPGSGVKLCKEFGVLFNPMNEKDKKEHKKEHAAYLRSKSKSKGQIPER